MFNKSGGQADTIAEQDRAIRDLKRELAECKALISTMRKQEIENTIVATEKSPSNKQAQKSKDLKDKKQHIKRLKRQSEARKIDRDNLVLENIELKKEIGNLEKRNSQLFQSSKNSKSRAARLKKRLDNN